MSTGAEKLVRHLHKHGIPMALASGSDRHNFDLKTKNHQELFSLFHHTVLSSSDSEVKHGKPSPDCFFVAAARFEEPVKSENVSYISFCHLVVQMCIYIYFNMNGSLNFSSVLFHFFFFFFVGTGF